MRPGLVTMSELISTNVVSQQPSPGGVQDFSFMVSPILRLATLCLWHLVIDIIGVVILVFQTYGGKLLWDFILFYSSLKQKCHSNCASCFKFIMCPPCFASVVSSSMHLRARALPVVKRLPQ